MPTDDDPLKKLVSKMAYDPSASAILERLTESLSESDRERLFLDLVVEKYLPHAERFRGGWYQDEEVVMNLQKCYRKGLDTYPSLGRPAMQRFLRAVLEESNISKLDAYREGLFRAGDLCLLSRTDAEVVKNHVLSRLKEEITFETFYACNGIGPYLTPDEALQFIDTVVLIFPWLGQICLIRLRCCAEMTANEVESMSTQAQSTALHRLRSHVDQHEGPVVRELALLAHHVLKVPAPPEGYFFLEEGTGDPPEGFFFPDDESDASY